MKLNEKYDLFTNDDLKMFNEIMSIHLLKHFDWIFPFDNSYVL